MSFRAKQRLVCAFLVVFALWPLAHRALVASQSINPWRYAGWAMYCTPKLPVEVALVPERDGQPVDLDLPQPVRDKASRFADRRAVAGRFADPRALAGFALDSMEIDSVVVTLEHSRLDPRTDRVAARREYLRYSRDDEGRVFGVRFAVRDLP